MLRINGSVVWFASAVWVFYFVIFLRKYYYLQIDIDDLFIVSAVKYKQPSPSVSLLLFSRNENMDKNKVLYALTNNTDAIFSIKSGNNYLNNVDGKIYIAHSFIDQLDPFLLSIEERKTKFLHENVGRVGLKISSIEADATLRQVVTCSAPITRGDWPSLLTGLTTFISYGSFVHIPHATISSHLFRALRIFENFGKAKIVPWIPLKKLLDYDPNIYAEQHSNTLAYLDCYLQYKNSAEFIIFSPLDEVVLPHVEQSYPAEFRALFLSRARPLIHYNIKRTERVVHKSMASFMPSDILHGINFNGTVGNHIRIADIKAMNEEEVNYENDGTLPDAYIPKMVAKIGRNPVSHSKLSLIDATFDRMRNNPIFASAFIEMKRACKRTFDGWTCQANRCIFLKTRFDSLFGAYYYNIHQSIKTSVYNQPCSII